VQANIYSQKEFELTLEGIKKIFDLSDQKLEKLKK
jgi:hypothetical protein